MSPRAHQHGGALADIGSDQFEAAFIRSRQRRHQQRQRQRHGEPTQPPGQRRNPDQRCQQPQHQRPGRCSGRRPNCKRPAREQAQKRDHGLDQGGGDGPQRVDQHPQHCQRRDQQRDQRDRHQVGDKSQHGELLEEHQRQRRKAERGHDLGAQVLGQPAAPSGSWQCSGGVVVVRSAGRRRLGRHQQGHRRERQPEASLQQRPGVERGDDVGRDQQHQQPRPAQADAAHRHAASQHQHGALGRYAPAGQKRIAGRHDHAAQACGQRRRHGQHQPAAAPPGRANHRAGQPGEHRDMHAADRDQVGNAGLAKDIPILALDRRLVADHQRRQYAGQARVGDAAPDRVADRLPGALDRVRGGALQQHGRGALAADANAAGGAHALLEPPQFGVKAMWVERAVGLLQAQRQAPALTGADGVARLVQRRLVAIAAEPAQRQLGRQVRGQVHRLAVQAGLLDFETEACARCAVLRHCRDHARDQQVAALQRRVQGVGQARIGTPASHTKAQCRPSSDQRQQPNGASTLPAQHRQDQQQTRRAQSEVRRQRPERRLLQLQCHAGQPSQATQRDPAPRLQTFV